jgi:TonB family protein
MLERAVGGGSVDHLEDIDKGDETSLSAKRWIYASFFNRLKRQVAQNWDPASVWRREDPEGKHYGFKAKVTQLRVSLDNKGKITKVLVVTPSGVDALDDEAIRAFKAAEPFPNPPGALVDRDGNITFDFGFHFSIDQKRTSWKITRSM